MIEEEEYQIQILLFFENMEKSFKDKNISD